MMCVRSRKIVSLSGSSHCVNSSTEFRDLPGQLGRVGGEIHKQPALSVYQLISLQTLSNNTIVEALGKFVGSNS